MRAGRLPVGLGLCGLAVAGWALTAAPSGADTTPGAAPATITFTSPASDGQVFTTPAPGATGSGVTLGGLVSRPGGNIDSVVADVQWTDTVAGRPKASHPDQQKTLTPPSPQSSFGWSFDLPVLANGGYTVVVTANSDTGGPQETAIAAEKFVLDLPPAVPANVTEAVQKNKRTVTLSWTANTEPDLVGYWVQRAGPSTSDAFKTIGGVPAPATSWTDASVASQPAGTYRYQVIAARQSGVDASHLDTSAPSAESDATLTGAPLPAQPPSTGAGSGAGAGAGHGGTAPGSTSGATSSGPGLADRAAALSNNAVLPGGDPLSSYQALVSQAQSTTVTAPPPDTGYAENLPYQPQTSRQQVTLPGDGPLPATGGGTNHRTVEYIAGALLLAVVAMFMLLIKRVADQAPALEAVEPLPPDSPLMNLLEPVDSPTLLSSSDSMAASPSVGDDDPLYDWATDLFRTELAGASRE